MKEEELLNEVDRVTLKELAALVYQWTLSYGEDAVVTTWALDGFESALIVNYREDKQ